MAGMQLTIHTLDSAPDASRPLLEGIAADLGLVPNMAATIAESPILLGVFDALRRGVASTGLDPVHREAAGLAVSVAVDNAYGVAFHSMVLGRLGVTDAEIAAIQSGGLPSEPVCAAVCGFATELVLARGKVDPATVDVLLGAGLTREGLLEIVAECTFAGMIGVVDNLAGRVVLDEFLAQPAHGHLTP